MNLLLAVVKTADPKACAPYAVVAYVNR